MIKKTKIGEEIGQSGVAIFGGIISNEEYNSDLYGQSGYDIFDEMRRSDASVRASLQAVKLPILSTSWYLECDQEDKEDELIKDVIKYNLFNHIDWSDTLRQIMTYFEFGFSVFEKVYTIKEYEGKQYIMLDKLALRKQSTITNWGTEKNENGITQTTDVKGTVDIPGWKIVRFANDQEGDNYEGISILRSAYKSWYIKKNLEEIQAIGYERQAIGIPKLTIASGVKETDKAKAREIVRNIRANEESYVELPAGIELEFMDMKSGTLQNPTDTINHLDRQILKSVLAQFLELGAKDSSGSYALSEDHSNLFMMSENYHANYIKEIIQKSIIQDLIDLNWPDKKAPQLKFDKLGNKDLQSYGESLLKLTQSKLLTPDATIEEHIRNIYNLPEMSDEMKENYDQIKEISKDDPLEMSIGDNKYEIRKIKEDIQHKLFLNETN